VRGIDKGETPVAAVMREVKEETGLDVIDYHTIGNANQFFPTS
jgi:8-oxo-dGTP pyrophosphatase MutT (NUDIX family)